MEAVSTRVSPNELKKLFFSIQQHNPPICIRYRTLGQLWYPNFLRIAQLEDGEPVFFHDAMRNKLLVLPDLSQIVQFELDGKIHGFEPNCHYQVTDDALLREE